MTGVHAGDEMLTLVKCREMMIEEEIETITTIVWNLNHHQIYHFQVGQQIRQRKEEMRFEI